MYNATDSRCFRLILAIIYLLLASSNDLINLVCIGVPLMSSYTLSIIFSTCSCISLLLYIVSVNLASSMSALFTLTSSLLVLNLHFSIDSSFHCLSNLIALLYFSSSVIFFESSYSYCTDFGSSTFVFSHQKCPYSRFLTVLSKT